MYIEWSFQIKSVTPLAYAITILALLAAIVAAADVIDTSTNIT